MPQDVRELGRLVKAKYPGAYDRLPDEEVGRLVKQKYPGAYDQFVDTPAQDANSLLTNAAEAIKSGGRFLYSGCSNVSGALGSALNQGDFGPLGNIAESVGRGALKVVDSISAAQTGNPATAQIQDAAIQRLAQERLQNDPQLQALAERDRQYEEFARRNASRAARVVRGVSKFGVEALPTIAAGAVTGGSIPAMAATAAISSMGAPETLPLAVGFGVLGGGGLASASGKSAAEILPQEAAAAARGAQMALPGMEGMLEASVAKAAAKSPWQDTVLAYYRANLLTNPAGRASDLGSTVINQFADAAARPIAAAVDVVVSKLTGARSITGPSFQGTARAFGSLRQGLRDAGEVLRTGRQAIDGGAEGAYGAEMLSGLGKVVDVPINGVFRILGALDAPFRRFGFSRNLYDRAKVAALNEARQDIIPQSYLTQRIQQLLDDPGIIAAAVRDGEKAVLSEPNRISSWLSMQTSSSPNARLAIGLVQPFMRIPLNAVAKAADFSGLGGVKAMYKIARGVGRKARGQSFFRDIEEQRVFSQNVAAGSFAPAAFILGMELEERGKMIGYFLASKKHYTNSNVPTSINIGGENYDINRLGGFIAAPLFIGATYNRLRKQNADKANALLRSFSGLIQTAPSLGYYGVLAKAGRLLTAEEPGDVILQEAGSTASGFIPASGALGAAAKALDANRKRETPGFTGPILNRVPGLRQRLPVKDTRRGRK